MATLADVLPIIRPRACGDCADGIAAPFEFTMAFQPIVDVRLRQIYAFEALVRGPADQSAFSVLSQVTPINRYAFDQSCRVKAIELATKLGLVESGAKLSINFIPGAMYRPDNCVRTTLAAARRNALPNDRIILELTENEPIIDIPLLEQIFDVYRRNNLRVAIDDFGSGFSGLSLLARFQPDTIKIDMDIVRGLDVDTRRRCIIGNIVRMAGELGVNVVAEGAETAAEVAALVDLGVYRIQGYYFARPRFEALPSVAW